MTKPARIEMEINLNWARAYPHLLEEALRRLADGNSGMKFSARRRGNGFLLVTGEA